MVVLIFVKFVSNDVALYDLVHDGDWFRPLLNAYLSEMSDAQKSSIVVDWALLIFQTKFPDDVGI